MPIANKQTIKRVTSPDYYGATRYVYENYGASSTNVIANNFFDDDDFDFAFRDLMWCKLSNGYFTLRFISPTTAEIATD